ncbi:MAG: TRAP transporter substrate-binding protein DctP [Desulfatiglandaceae bacterium]
MTRLKFFLIATCITFSLTIFTVPGVSFAGEVVLNWASFLPRSHPETVSLQQALFDKINERGKGKLVIKYRGGPETFPARDIGDALGNGIVDIASALVTFYQAIVPGAAASRLSPYLPAEERKNGVYDYLDALHQKYGIKYLGRPNPGRDTYFYTYLTKKVEKPEDFKGLRLGAAGSARPAVLAMGASVVTLKLSEYYSAMEKHLVDGITAVPPAAWVAWGCHEKTKFIPDHPYFQSTGMLIMNLKSWNKLPKDLQDLIMNTMRKYEVERVPVEIAKAEKADETMRKAGVQFYKFSPEMAKWYHDKIYNSSWQDEEKRFGSVVTNFRKLMPH